MAALGLLFCGFLLMTNAVVNGSYNLESQVAKIEAINSSVESIRFLNTYVENREMEKFANRAALSAFAANGAIENGWYGMSEWYDDGAIVTVSDGKIEYPVGYPEEQKIDAASLTDSYGELSFDIKKDIDPDAPKDVVFVEYYKIGSNIYYIESVLGSALKERVKISFDMHSRMKGIEDALGIRVFFVSGEKNADGKHVLLYKSSALPEEIDTAEDLGITQEMLGVALDATQPLTAEKLWDYSRVIELDGAYWQAFVQTANGSRIFNEKEYLIYLVPEDEFFSMTAEQTFVMLAVFLIVGIILLVWYFTLISIVRSYSLNEEQAEQLGVKKTAMRAFSTVAIGCVVLFIVAALFLSLFRLFGVCNSVKKSLKVLEQRIEENKIQEKTTIDELKNSYVSYAERIARNLEERPGLVTKENLQALSDMMGADYIMIYDKKGKEVISNSKYVNMEFGSSPESSTYEFRRLLKGIPSVVHDPKTDEETGLTNAIVGVCMENPEMPDTYGALLIALPEDTFVPEKLETMDDVMKSLVADGTISFSIDPEDKMVINASESVMVGKNAASLSLPEAAIVDSYRDFFTLVDISCYGESMDVDGFLYYYAAEQPHIYKNILLYAGIAAAAGFVLLTVLIAYMLFGYRKGFEYWSTQGEDLVDGTDDSKQDISDSEQFVDPRKRWALSLSKYGLRTPVRNASVTLEILLVALIIGMGAWYYFKGANVSGSLLGFILHGQWSKGLNLFSFTSILILFAAVLIAVWILKLLVRIITSSMGQKGETFCRLTLNLLTYAGVIFFIYMALYNLGINLGALIASLSLPAFALSLGAKDLITDIVAGISLVFDGEFKVGDIVEINGYYGKLTEIGVRTTKLEGIGGNIKIISNRDVKNVLNMSRKISFYSVDVKISTYYYRLKDVEEMLKRELPKLEGQIPGATRGPYYNGVIAVGDRTVTLSIRADFEQKYYGKVKRAMNHTIQTLFDEQGIAIW